VSRWELRDIKFYGYRLYIYNKTTKTIDKRLDGRRVKHNTDS